MWSIPGLAETGVQARILNAAFRCFARYGYARTSMTDIAAEAGLSRTALYQHYSRREDIFLALSKRVNEGVRRAVVEASKLDGDLEARLHAVLAARACWAFEALHLSEHGRELIDAKNELCGADGVETEAQFLKLLKHIIAAAGKTTVGPGEAAALIMDCFPGLIANETSAEAARERLARFVRVFAAGLSLAPKRGSK
jgi:AcrR family transcriptional regulator